jgi:hypothetical protein
MQSVNTTFTNTTTDVLRATFASIAAETSNQSLKTGLTWNGDVNYSSLGETVEAALMAFDHKMVLPQSCQKEAMLDEDMLTLFDDLFSQIIETVRTKSDEERARIYELMFRYMFYLRSVRVPGKKSRLLFYYFFKKIYQIFPETCVALLSLVPEYGYFGDIDYLISYMSDCIDVVNGCLNVYKNYLDIDCQAIFGKPLSKVTKDEAVELNQRLKKMSVSEIRTLQGDKKLSLAAKWFAREDHSNSSHRTNFLVQVYFPNGGITDLLDSDIRSAKDTARRRLNYCQMVFRHIISALTQFLVVGETMMCAKDSDARTWQHIPHGQAPAGFMTKYRKALANEKLKVPPSESELETGNRHPDNPDRVQCRQNLVKALIDGKIKGAAQDLDKLSKIISEHVKQRYAKLSSTERHVISAQWKDIVSKLKAEITKIVEEAREEAAKTGEVFIDPRNVIPVIDTSGSMCGAQVDFIAIGLGILASSLSTLPGCCISFSDNPQVFHLDMSDKSDVFDHFQTIAKGPMGFGTNVDATYRLLLSMMVKKGVKDVDFAMLFLTDEGFDEQVLIIDEVEFQQTFLNRIEAAFKKKGYNLPRMIFWNLNAKTPGFPATNISRGVQLVSGYSQALMFQVFTGDYKYEVQEDGSVKVSVSPWESFLKALLHEGYNRVSEKIAFVGEGCLKHLALAAAVASDDGQ